MIKEILFASLMAGIIGVSEQEMRESYAAFAQDFAQDFEESTK